MLRVAACAYPIDAPARFEVYAAKQASWVEAAAAQGAQLLVFPEYACLELTAALPSAVRGDLQRELHAVQVFRDALCQLFGDLALQHRVHILAPSFPELDAPAPDARNARSVQAPSHARPRFVNRATLHAPDGQRGSVEKVQMTRFESEEWGITAGQQLPVFDTTCGMLGVTICYDSEFPLLTRQQVEQGAEVLLVPSCTDTLAGYHRVALSCRARALENQCYVVQSSTVGEVPESLVLDVNRGAAGIFGPVDRGFPDDGVVAQGPLDTPGWVTADLDLDAIARVRADGAVRNHRDWRAPSHGDATSPRLSFRSSGAGSTRQSD